MKNTPHKALKIGAETLNQHPVKYNKSRLSRSQSATYFLHPKAIYMPGQKEIFSPSAKNFNDFNSDLNQNQGNRAFQLKNAEKVKKPIGPKYYKSNLDQFTFGSYTPNDDESLEVAIKAAYRQIFGNLNLMESERPVDIERRLRNGDISIKEFIRNISKSPIYLNNYFYNISQLRCIELTYKHILGRPPIKQDEIIKSIIVMNDNGFNSQIDSLIDSNEYKELFGDDIVPYMRSWSSEIGLTSSAFLKTSLLTKSFSSSDICF